MSESRFFVGMLAILVFCLAGSGCRPPPDLEQRQQVMDEPCDFIIDLGEDVKMRFMFIEALGVFVGKFETTNAEFRRFRQDHSSGKYKDLNLDNPDQPVVNVSWDDAKAFCKWLGGEFDIVDGKKLTFRLPSVDEWDVFASCGEPSEFPWGNFWPPPEDWNYYGSENSGPGAKLEVNDGYRVSSPVDKSGVNEWRLFGVGGNVWEWCEDAGDAAGKTHILKGGSWVDCHPLFLGLSRTRMYAPDYRAVNMGFRLVLETRDATPEELEAFEARRKAAEDKKIADKVRQAADAARQEAEAARQAAERAEREQRERREGMARAQGEIRGALLEGRHAEAAPLLASYQKEFGPDEFHSEISAILDRTRWVRLSEDSAMEFVRINDFDCWVGRFEVSNREFRRFRGDHSSGSFRDYDLDGDLHPVVEVSWNDGNEFCAWLNSLSGGELDAGYVFRLPTEREWEAFASCGKTRDFPWGSEWPPLYGNFGTMENYEDGFPVTCPVVDSGENEWGVCGMGGNVWEWCDGSAGQDGSLRIIKGGAWNLSRPDALKIVNRSEDIPERKNSFIGFRVIIGRKPAGLE